MSSFFFFAIKKIENEGQLQPIGSDRSEGMEGASTTMVDGGAALALGEEDWPKAAESFRAAWNRVAGAVSSSTDPSSSFLEQAGAWELRTSAGRSGRCYLALEGVRVVGAGMASPGAACLGGEVDLWESSDEDGREREGREIALRCVEGDHYHLYDFHILYNPSYAVPELYFYGRRAADGLVLGPSEAAEDFASVTPYPAAELRRAYVSKDHPYLLLPWLGTHLCETPALVREMVRGACAPDPALRYMLSWWSAVGKHFGLGLPLDKLSNY